MITIGRATILVKDLDAARDFYANAFGFVTIFDEEIFPGFRALHVGPEGESAPGFWLIRATTPDAESRVGRQTGDEPAFVLYTDDLAADLTRLAALGVHPIKGPTEDESKARFVHIRDNSGNELVLVQLPT